MTENTCRVCFGPSEPLNQLYYPCKCDGSIKYIHQQCLTQWLVSKRRALGATESSTTPSKCELCGEIFHFQEIYAADAPTRLSVLEIAAELVPRFLSALKLILNVCFGILLWGIIFPMYTNW